MLTLPAVLGLLEPFHMPVDVFELPADTRERFVTSGHLTEQERDQ